MVIALDRQEKGKGEKSAIQEVESDYAIPVAAITKLEHLISYLEEGAGDADTLASIRAYRAQYGI